jgi:hypothetical protein
VFEISRAAQKPAATEAQKRKVYVPIWGLIALIPQHRLTEVYIFCIVVSIRKLAQLQEAADSKSICSKKNKVAFVTKFRFDPPLFFCEQRA